MSQGIITAPTPASRSTSGVAPDAILDFWFGELDGDGLATDEFAKQWWAKDPKLDGHIRSRFGELHGALRSGQHAEWLVSARGRLAAIIVLDQFSRNMYRDTADMFGSDERALGWALEGIDLGMDRELPVDPRAFCYLPLMHAEHPRVQDRCVQLFETLAGELRGCARERVANNLRFAQRHRDIVARFGRFPHRNAILGRPSTAEELEFLQQPGSSF